jgi:hypothetical protein
MAQDDRFDLARLERLERRLQALEDAGAIRNLKALYATLCDAQYDADGIAMLFTEDALWESRGLGRFEGRISWPICSPRWARYHQPAGRRNHDQLRRRHEPSRAIRP